MAGLRRSRADGERGAELIELAIVLPILLLCVAGIVDFGFLLQRYAVVTNAAREGARLAALPNYTVLDVQSRINSYLAAGGLTGGPTPYVNLNATITLPSDRVINVAQVVVWYPAGLTYMGPIAGLIGGRGHGSMMLRATSTMRAEVGSGGS